MTDPDDQAALVDAAARLSGVPVDPAWRPAVLASFAAVAAAYALVAAFPLDDAMEFAPVFRA